MAAHFLRQEFTKVLECLDIMKVSPLCTASLSLTATKLILDDEATVAENIDFAT